MGRALCTNGAMTTSGTATTHCAASISGPITTNARHAQLRAQRVPATPQDFLHARGGSGCLYRCLLGAVCAGGHVVGTRQRKPHPVARLRDCPAPRAFSTQRDVPHPWAHHLDLWVPPDGVTIYPLPSPPRQPSPLKRYTPAMVPAGLRRTHVPQGSRTMWRSPPPCAHYRTPAGQCLATRRLRRWAICSGAMPLWLLVQPAPLSNMLWHHPDHRDPPNCGSQPYNMSPLVGHVVTPKGHVERRACALGHSSRHVGRQSDGAQTAGTWPCCSFRPCNMSPLVGHVAVPTRRAGHAKQHVHALRHTPTSQHGVLHDRHSSSHLATGPVAVQAAGLIVRMRQRCVASWCATTAAACINHACRCATYLGMSPRLRRASWAASKAAQSHGTSPAAAPDPTACHRPCDAPNTLNDMFMPSGTSPGVPNAGLMTPRRLKQLGRHPTVASRPTTARPLWMCHNVSGHPDMLSGPSTTVHQLGTWLQPCPRPHDSSPPL